MTNRSARGVFLGIVAFGAMGTLGACKDMARLDTAGRVPPTEPPAARATAPAPAAPESAGSNAATEGAAGQEASRNLGALLGQLHEGNLKEIRSGQLAQEKGRAREVKEYGAMLVRHHQEADQKLLSLAQGKNVALGEAALSPESAAALEQLQAQSGAAFDRAFARLMVESHEKTIALVRQAQTDVRDDAVKGMLTGLLPTLEQHRDQAQSLVALDATKTSAAPGEAGEAVQGRRPARR